MLAPYISVLPASFPSSFCLFHSASVWAHLSKKGHAHQKFLGLSPFIKDFWGIMEGTSQWHKVAFCFPLSLPSLFEPYPWFTFWELQVLLSPLKKTTFSFFEVWHSLIPEDLVGVEGFEGYQPLYYHLPTYFSKYGSGIFEITPNI